MQNEADRKFTIYEVAEKERSDANAHCCHLQRIQASGEAQQAAFNDSMAADGRAKAAWAQYIAARDRQYLGIGSLRLT